MSRYLGSLGLFCLYLALVWVIGDRIGSDGDERLMEGRLLAADTLTHQAQWFSATGNVKTADRLDKAAQEMVGYPSKAVKEAVIVGDPEDPFRHGKKFSLNLLEYPPPNTESASMAEAWALHYRGGTTALDITMEDNPLGVLTWRAGPDGERHPWAEAILKGMLAQDALSIHGQPRPRFSHVAMLDPITKQLLLDWCLLEAARLTLPVCHRNSELAVPDLRKLLADVSLPSQAVISLAASLYKADVLYSMAMEETRTRRERRLALMAFARTPDEEGCIQGLMALLTVEDPPLFKMIAALELLRLGAKESAPLIRIAATPLGSVESLTMRWAADLLEGEAIYARASL